MKIKTDEQYEIYEKELQKLLSDCNGCYHNFIDTDHEQSFSRGDATDEQIRADVKHIGLAENDNIEELSNEVCYYLAEILDRRLEKKYNRKRYEEYEGSHYVYGVDNEEEAWDVLNKNGVELDRVEYIEYESEQDRYIYHNIKEEANATEEQLEEKIIKGRKVTLNKENNEITLQSISNPVEIAIFSYEHFGVTTETEVDYVFAEIEDWIERQNEKIIMKKSEIIENLKNQNLAYEEFEVNTDYEDQETGEYLEAVATLRINVDGTHTIMNYSYYDCENDLHDTFEYDWDKNSIERTFNIEIDC
jgi:hypothetical protein